MQKSRAHESVDKRKIDRNKADSHVFEIIRSFSKGRKRRPYIIWDSGIEYDVQKVHFFQTTRQAHKKIELPFSKKILK